VQRASSTACTARETRRPRRLNLRLRAERPDARRDLGRQRSEELFGIDRQWCRAARATAALRRRSPVVQERVELDRDAFACGAEQVEELRRAVLAAVAEAGRDPVEVGVVGRQDMRLLVVEVLDAMLDAAQQRVGIAQAGAGGALHETAGDELVDRLQR
jgi:hypothetical protein